MKTTATLGCAIVTPACEITVEIDLSETVDQLKDAIKETCLNSILFDAHKRRLYLARRTDTGAWLNCKHQGVKASARAKYPVRSRASCEQTCSC